MEQNEQIFYAWLSGLLDGDGCFSIGMSLRNGRLGQYVEFKPQVRIALKEKDYKTLDYILNISLKGKIYYSNKGKENGICSWQTTRLDDAIYILEKVLPYLITKKDKGILFLQCLKDYKLGFDKKGKRMLGRIRNKEVMLKIAKASTSINYDRQTKRYRNYKNYEYWERVINELYK